MPAYRDIVRRIDSIRNTQKITKAMQVVAATRLRKAQAAVQATRPYADKMVEVLQTVSERATEYKHPFLVRREGKRAVMILVTTDKGLAGEDFEDFLASENLGLALIRPARKDEKEPRYFPNWLRQRVEAVIWALKNQLGPERHGGRVPAGLWARIVQRLLALNACIWHNWMIGAPVKRSLIAYDHV